MKKKYVRLVVWCFIICLEFTHSFVAFAWSPIGHQIVAQIAYNQLSPHAREHVLKMVELWNQHDADAQSFDRSAAWADLIKGSKVRAFNSWHYIDHSYVVKGSHLPKLGRVKGHHAVWAINQCLAVLHAPKGDPMLKAFFLRMLLHTVGDLHQPLHCISRYSVDTPEGDLGGNRFPINVRGKHNLHAYWDSGLGLFPKSLAKHIDSEWVMKTATAIIQHYPPAFFGDKLESGNIMKWSWESYKIARQFAYTAKWNKKPSQAYQQRGQAIVQQQLALAGYRLAHLLEDLDT